MPSPRVILPLILLALVLAGCGSGGGGGGGGAPAAPAFPATPPVTLAGMVTYDHVPTSASGLDYGATASRPVRGAVVEIRNTAGTSVYARASTNASGAYSIQAPGSTSILVVVLAALGDPAAPNARVVDNTSGGLTYGVYQAKATTVANETGVNLHAASGWGGSSYTAPRVAGPFAILDVVYRAQALVRAADAAVTFPALRVNWSPANTLASIETSYFDPNTGELFILGGADEDTDEYDDHVVAHEWGHWFESNFSRSDSLGGGHTGGDILDETVAFGEGFGNALSGMIMGDPMYRDTSGVGQAQTRVLLDLETDAISEFDTVGNTANPPTADGRRLDGAWSETSVQELLWDIYDGPGTTADADSDGVALGFTPVYQVLIGSQRTFPGFTSIYSFLHFLKLANPGRSAAIVTLEANENIGAHDAYEESARRRYTVLPSNGTTVTMGVDGRALSTEATYGTIDDYGGNMLYNRLFFRVEAPSSGTWRIRATPNNASHDVAITRGGGLSPQLIDDFFGGSERGDVIATAGQPLVFSVRSFPITGNPSGVTPFSIRFGTPLQVAKPQPAPAPTTAAPVSNG